MRPAAAAAQSPFARLSIISVLSTSPLLSCRRYQANGRRPPPPPPPLPGGKKMRLPPPPPLRRVSPTAPTSSSSNSSMNLPWKSPQEVLSTFIEFIPTFYVSLHAVAAVLSEESRECFLGRGKFLSFLRRYPFYFDIRMLDSSRVDVKLREDVSHPRRGAADEKYAMTDVGEVVTYVAKPEHIVSLDSIDCASQSVSLQPPMAPPAVRVQLEERVPVVDRLRALMPAEFTPLEAVEETLPEDILYHPYFDCQGGLSSIACKFPSEFQVVDGRIRQRPPHLAPLALNDFALADSPLPDVAALVQGAVCDSDIPHWVSITFLYEQLTRQQKQEIKRDFKSFAGFLRAHGRSLSISIDMLQVAMWTPPPAAPSTRVNSSASGDAVKLQYTRTQVINELFDRLPPHKSLNLVEALELLPSEMRAHSLPKQKNILPWLHTFPQYFLVADPAEKDPLKARISRASGSQPLDLAVALYPHLGGAEGTPISAVLEAVSAKQRDLLQRMGFLNLVRLLPEWLALVPAPSPTAKEEDVVPSARLVRVQSLDALETALVKEERKASQREAKEAMHAVEDELREQEVRHLERPAPFTGRK